MGSALDSANQALEILFASKAIEAFLDQFHRNRTSVHGGSGQFTGLISWEELDEVIAFAPTYNGISFKPHHAIHPGLPLNLSTCYRLFSEGFTMVIPNMESRFHTIANFVSEFAEASGYATTCDLWAAMNPSEPWHWDSGEFGCFALQLDGNSRWHLKVEGTEPSSITLEPLEVAPGQILYLPPHQNIEFEPFRGANLLLVLKIELRTWKDLIHASVDHVAKRVEAMRSGFILQDPNDAREVERISNYLSDLLPELSASPEWEQAKQDLLVHQLETKIPLPSGHFAQIEGIEILTENSLLEHRPGMSGHMLMIGDSVEFPFVGNEIDGPGKLCLALDYILETPRFKPRDIPGWYSPEERVIIARSLISTGFLRMVDGDRDGVLI